MRNFETVDDSLLKIRLGQIGEEVTRIQQARYTPETRLMLARGFLVEMLAVLYGYKSAEDWLDKRSREGD